MSIFKFKIITPLFFLITGISSAAEQPQTFMSVRLAGMGAVSVADIDPSSILFTNPAGLSFIDGGRTAKYRT